MVNQVEQSQVENNVGKSQSFSIAQNMNILDILSNKMYEQPIEAIVREVYSNAIDANIEGKTSGKIDVVLPTKQNPVFRVTDHGIGMTDEKVRKVYCEYGNSTKGDDNSQIGGFGIGCKTPFAYTDQFTVTTSKNGKKNSYVAFKGETGYELVPASSSDCDESGTTVEVPVKPEDMEDFITAAVKVFFFAKEFPNMDEISLGAFKSWVRRCLFLENEDEAMKVYMIERVRMQNGSSYFKKLQFGNNLLAEIGGVAYGIDSNVMKNDFFSGTIVIHIPVGEVSVQASREKLNYNKDTIAKLKKYFLESLRKFETEADEVLEDKSLSYIEKHNFCKLINVGRYEDAVDFCYR